MRPKIPFWVAVVLLALGLLVWLPKIFRHAAVPAKTAAGKHELFTKVMGEANKAAQQPQAQTRMLTWASAKLAVPAEQLTQEAQQYHLSAPELFYVYRLRLRGGSLIPIDEVLALKTADKDWYQVGLARGYYPTDYQADLKQMTEAGRGK